MLVSLLKSLTSPLLDKVSESSPPLPSIVKLVVAAALNASAPLPPSTPIVNCAAFAVVKSTVFAPLAKVNFSMLVSLLKSLIDPAVDKVSESLPPTPLIVKLVVDDALNASLFDPPSTAMIPAAAAPARSTVFVPVEAKVSFSMFVSLLKSLTAPALVRVSVSLPPLPSIVKSSEFAAVNASTPKFPSTAMIPATAAVVRSTVLAPLARFNFSTSRHLLKPENEPASVS